MDSSMALRSTQEVGAVMCQSRLPSTPTLTHARSSLVVAACSAHMSTHCMHTTQHTPSHPAHPAHTPLLVALCAHLCLSSAPRRGACCCCPSRQRPGTPRPVCLPRCWSPDKSLINKMGDTFLNSGKFETLFWTQPLRVLGAKHISNHAFWRHFEFGERCDNL